MKRMHSHQEIQDDSIAAFADKGVSVEDGVLKAPAIEQSAPSISHSYTIVPTGPIFITGWCTPKVALKVINGVLHLDVDVLLGNHTEEDYTGSFHLYFQGGLEAIIASIKRVDGTPLTANSTEPRIAYVVGIQDGTPIAAMLQSKAKNQLSLDATLTIAGKETASMISIHTCIPLI